MTAEVFPIKGIKKFLMTLGVIVLFLVLIGLFCFKLAVTPTNDGVFTAEPSAELAGEFVKGVILDGEYTVSEAQLNSFAAYMIGRSASLSDESDRCVITDIYLDIEQDEPWRCYLRAKKGDYTFDIAADCAMRIDDSELVLSFENAAVGKLPVSDAVLSYILGRANITMKAGYIDADALELRYPAHYGINIPDYGEVAAIDILTLETGGDSITVRTNHVVSDTVKDILTFVIDSIADYAVNKINNM